MNPEILLAIIKLSAGGLISFLAIFLMSKIREPGWTCLVCGFLFSYAAKIFEILVDLKVISHLSITLWGMPLTALLCIAIPTIFYILGFILMLIKK
ncbi:MAG: hypothetical protein K5866_01695 [Treponema sp.]|nr:hypothetical protein [Treponema sp.]